MAPSPLSFIPCPVRKAETGLGTVERGLAMKGLQEGKGFSERGGRSIQDIGDTARDTPCPHFALGSFFFFFKDRSVYWVEVAFWRKTQVERRVTLPKASEPAISWGRQ